MSLARRAVHKWRRLKAQRLANLISGAQYSVSLLNSSIQNLRGRINIISLPPMNYPESLAGNLSQNKETIVKDADGVIDHYFDFLGSGKKNFNIQPGKIDWHLDFKSGIEWDSKGLYSDIPIIQGRGSDIKVPWELSRFQHLPTLGKAYWLTKDKKYVHEFISEIDDWIDENPPCYGVNWACTMDVAIRAVNWIWGYNFFKDSPELSDEFLAKFLKSLYVHGEFIHANLERSSRLMAFAGSLIRKHPNFGILKPGWHEPVSNHYLSDITGLVYLGIMFPEFKDAQKWRDFAVNELINEMKFEVYPDGSDYEGSISYHRLVTELFLSATLLCLKNDISFPNWYMQRLENMLDFVLYYSKPDGKAPQIGDNDDGRLHILADYGKWDRLDHRYLLSMGAILFNRPDFKRAAGNFHEEAFWILSSDSLQKYDEIPDIKFGIGSKAFDTSGYYFIRKDNLYMAVDCLNMEKNAPSGHKHNSRLSFELFADDKSFLIDPGAYIYTADKEMRNLFRSTGYHNTVVVDGEEQNRINQNELFSLERDSVVKVNKWDIGEKLDVLDVEHYGYKRLKYPVTHRRHIVFNKVDGYWIVTDTLTGEYVHQLDLYFHFAPMEIETDENFPLVIKTRTKGKNLAIIPLKTDGVSLEIQNGWISYQYGVKLPAPIAKYSLNSSVPVSFCNVLYPYSGDLMIDKVVRQAQGIAGQE